MTNSWNCNVLSSKCSNLAWYTLTWSPMAQSNLKMIELHFVKTELHSQATGCWYGIGCKEHSKTCKPVLCKTQTAKLLIRNSVLMDLRWLLRCSNHILHNLDFIAKCRGLFCPQSLLHLRFMIGVEIGRPEVKPRPNTIARFHIFSSMGRPFVDLRGWLEEIKRSLSSAGTLIMDRIEQMRVDC